MSQSNIVKGMNKLKIDSKENTNTNKDVGGSAQTPSKEKDKEQSNKESKESKDKKNKRSKEEIDKARRRLSLMAASPKVKPHKLDGVLKKKDDPEKKQQEKAKLGKKKKGRVFTRYASLSKVGFVPFNPAKVNQDRSIEIVKFGGSDQKALFGVFDGHGSCGHEASSFVAAQLPQFLLKQKTLDSAPKASCTKAFIECNNELSKSQIDVTFSGTTAVSCYLMGKRLFCCNAGDSRCVLATRLPNGKLKAVPLSNDHKPDVPEERKRILESKGRVESCKGPKGEDIGPPRVWLQTQDVPGLAMTRSMGDQVASSVGVIAKPEIIDHTIDDNDCFFILASDGVWEFISNQEAVDIVAKCDGPESACRSLVAESVARWQREEEVVDDITTVIVFLAGYDPSKPFVPPSTIPADSNTNANHNNSSTNNDSDEEEEEGSQEDLSPLSTEEKGRGTNSTNNNNNSSNNSSSNNNNNNNNNNKNSNKNTQKKT